VSHFIIRTPIWNGGKRYVGLAEYRLSGLWTTFNITYCNKKGELIYPNQFRIKTKDVLNCPIEMCGGMKLRIVPLMICHEHNDNE